jgi:integral membrane sensor domain MASE1
MNLIYKILPYCILTIVAGFFIGIGNGSIFWGYVGLGLIIASGVLLVGLVLIITIKQWRKNKATSDKRLSEVSVTLIFNAIVALLLFGYLTWKDIEIRYVDNMLFLLWAAINLGALRVLWVPKDDDTKIESFIVDGSKEEKN